MPQNAHTPGWIGFDHASQYLERKLSIITAAPVFQFFHSSPLIANRTASSLSSTLADAEARADLADAQPGRLTVHAVVDVLCVVAVRQPGATRGRSASQPFASVQLLQPERNHSPGKWSLHLCYRRSNCNSINPNLTLRSLDCVLRV